MRSWPYSDFNGRIKCQKNRVAKISVNVLIKTSAVARAKNSDTWHYTSITRCVSDLLAHSPGGHLMATPRTGNPPGCPRKWPDPQEFAAQIKAYFDKCETGVLMPAVDRKGNPMVTDDGEPITVQVPQPYTMEGLAEHLGMTIEGVSGYAKRPEFAEFVSRARQKCRGQWVTMGLTGRYNPKMAALCLAAHDPTYRVNQQHEITVKSVEDKLREIEAQDAEIVPQIGEK